MYLSLSLYIYTYIYIYIYTVRIISLYIYIYTHTYIQNVTICVYRRAFWAFGSRSEACCVFCFFGFCDLGGGGRVLLTEMLLPRIARQGVVRLISIRGQARKARIEKFELDEGFPIDTCTNIYVCVCVYVYIYIYIYIYVHLYVYIYIYMCR